MDYVRRGLHNTFNSIKKHKLLFTLIVILQILFVASSLALGTQYLIKILEDTQGIIGRRKKLIMIRRRSNRANHSPQIMLPSIIVISLC